MNDSAENQPELNDIIDSAMATTDLILPENITMDDIILCAERLGQIHKRSMWAIGALIVKCEIKFGKGTVTISICQFGS